MGSGMGPLAFPRHTLPLYTTTPTALAILSFPEIPKPLSWHWLWSSLTFTAPQGQTQSGCCGFCPVALATSAITLDCQLVAMEISNIM